jgi:hypothetical protein
MTTTIVKEEILKQYNEMVNCFDKNITHEFVDGIELNCGLDNCKGICFDGRAYLLGVDSEFKTHLVQYTYPKLNDLNEDMKHAIIQYMGLDSDYVNDICFADSLICFGELSDTIFSEI